MVENPYTFGRKALIVDDTQTMRSVVRGCLKAIGIKEIVEAVNGEEAYSIVQSQQVNLIICDWAMPTMNGTELLKKLRENESYKDIPFLMLTGNADAELVSESMTLGVDAFVIKPFKPQTLCDKVIAMLKKRTSQD
ncbi:MAG: response regulator [Motiliproteus sp.]|nr:response regulator [Motiliproteus sp.]MCW9053657.1 response regulator [Motiliproteus sp.]